MERRDNEGNVELERIPGGVLRPLAIYILLHPFFSHSQNLQVCVSDIFPLKALFQGFSWPKLGSSSGGAVGGQLPARRRWGEVLCFPVTHFHIFSRVLRTGRSACTPLFAAAERSIVTTGSALVVGKFRHSIKTQQEESWGFHIVHDPSGVWRFYPEHDGWWRKRRSAVRTRAIDGVINCNKELFRIIVRLTFSDGTKSG